MMNEQEMDRLADLIAIKTSEQNQKFFREHVDTQIQIHAYRCAAGKWGWFTSFISAITGGVLVGTILWLINKI